MPTGNTYMLNLHVINCVMPHLLKKNALSIFKRNAVRSIIVNVFLEVRNIPNSKKITVRTNFKRNDPFILFRKHSLNIYFDLFPAS